MKVSVTERDVRHVAGLARFDLEADRIPALARELEGILGHMGVLARVDTQDVQPATGVGAGGMPLRADEGPQYPMACDRETLAAAMRDGFYLVPRLATHLALGHTPPGASAGIPAASGDDA